MVEQQDAEIIREALHQGKLSVPDSTGYHRSMHARCPNDGSRCSVYMTSRHGELITSVTFRCPVCGNRFEAPPEGIFLA